MSAKNWTKKNGKYVDPSTGKEVLAFKTADGRIVRDIYKIGLSDMGGRLEAIYDNAALLAAQKTADAAISKSLVAENRNVESSSWVKKGELFTFAGGADSEKNFDPEDRRAYRVSQLSDGTWVYVRGEKKASQTWATKNAKTIQMASVAANFIPVFGPAISLGMNTALTAHQANQGVISKDQFWKQTAVNVASAGAAKYGAGLGINSVVRQAAAQGVIRGAGAKWQGASTTDAMKSGVTAAAASGVAGKIAESGWMAKQNPWTKATSGMAIGGGSAFAVGGALGLSGEELRQQAIGGAIGGAIAAGQAKAAETMPGGAPTTTLHGTGSADGDPSAATGGGTPAPAAPAASDTGWFASKFSGIKSWAVDSAGKLRGGPPSGEAPAGSTVTKLTYDDNGIPIIPAGKSVVVVGGKEYLQSEPPKSFAEEHKLAITVLGQMVPSMAASYMQKQSSDKALKAQQESTAAQLERSDEATARTNALTEEYLASESSRVAPKISSVWN